MTSPYIVYEAIAMYFSPLTFTKIRNEGSYSLYYAVVGSLLSRDSRCCIAIVDRNSEAEGSKENLENLRWRSFQTRTLPEDKVPHLPSLRYNKKESPIIRSPIHKIASDSYFSEYQVSGIPNLRVQLIHNTKATNYTDNATLLSALLTFQCVLTLRN